MSRSTQRPYAGGLAQRVDLRHVPLRTPGSKRQAPRRRGIFMDVLVIDVGGTHVKILSTGQSDKREFASGPKMTAEQMVSGTREPADGWGTTLCGSAIPARFCTIGRWPIRKIWARDGWGSTLRRGSGGQPRSSTTPRCRRSAATRWARCLYLGLGTGLGSTLIVNGLVEPMELGHLPYKKATYEDYVGARGARPARQEEMAEARFRCR